VTDQDDSHPGMIACACGHRQAPAIRRGAISDCSTTKTGPAAAKLAPVRKTVTGLASRQSPPASALTMRRERLKAVRNLGLSDRLGARIEGRRHVPDCLLPPGGNAWRLHEGINLRQLAPRVFLGKSSAHALNDSQSPARHKRHNRWPEGIHTTGRPALPPDLAPQSPGRSSSFDAVA
jgi:hypothetical protein